MTSSDQNATAAQKKPDRWSLIRAYLPSVYVFCAVVLVSFLIAQQYMTIEAQHEREVVRNLAGPVDRRGRVRGSVPVGQPQTHPHLMTARAVGCDVMQGYCLAEPMSAKDMKTCLEQHLKA